MAMSHKVQAWRNNHREIMLCHLRRAFKPMISIPRIPITMVEQKTTARMPTLCDEGPSTGSSSCCCPTSSSVKVNYTHSNTELCIIIINLQKN